MVPNKYKEIARQNANGDGECTLVFVLKIEWFVVTFPVNSFWRCQQRTRRGKICDADGLASGFSKIPCQRTHSTFSADPVELLNEDDSPSAVTARNFRRLCSQGRRGLRRRGLECRVADVCMPCG